MSTWIVVIYFGILSVGMAIAGYKKVTDWRDIFFIVVWPLTVALVVIVLPFWILYKAGEGLSDK